VAGSRWTLRACIERWGGDEVAGTLHARAGGWCVQAVVTRVGPDGPSALERKGGAGSGDEVARTLRARAEGDAGGDDVAGSRWTLCTCIERWEWW